MESTLFNVSFLVNIIGVMYFFLKKMNKSSYYFFQLTFILILITPLLFYLSEYLPYTVLITISFFFILLVVTKNYFITLFLISIFLLIVGISYSISFDVVNYFFSVPFFFSILLEFIFLSLGVHLLLKIDKTISIFNYVLKYTRRKFLVPSIFVNIWIFFLYYHSYALGHYENKLITILITGLLCVYLGLIISFFWLSISNEYNEHKIEYYSELANKKNEYYQSLEEFRHDYKGILFSLYDSLESQDYQLAMDILNKINSYSNHIFYEEDFYKNLELIDSSIVRGGLISLNSYAKDMKVKLILNVYDPITNIKINNIDLTRLLNILITNSIEEVSKIETIGLRQVTCNISSDINNLITINVENPLYDARHVDIKKMFTRKYSDKKTHSGIGLYSFHRICNSYSNINYRSIINGSTFSILIEIS